MLLSLWYAWWGFQTLFPSAIVWLNRPKLMHLIQPTLLLSANAFYIYLNNISVFPYYLIGLPENFTLNWMLKKCTATFYFQDDYWMLLPELSMKYEGKTAYCCLTHSRQDSTGIVFHALIRAMVDFIQTSGSIQKYTFKCFFYYTLAFDFNCNVYI